MPTNEIDNNEIASIANVIMQRAESKGLKEEADIKALVEKSRLLFEDLTDEEVPLVTRRVLEKMGHFLDLGVMITASDHKSWYQARTRDLPMSYTKRNELYLKHDRGMNSGIVSILEETTDEILDGFGDPEEPAFKRRGLIMGDVQSGKTNTYTTICCKAADVGYRIIILLTGTLESLRRQTQARLDEGFVGRDSAHILKRNAGSGTIGVGNYEEKGVTVFTSTESDFKSSTANQVFMSIGSSRDPILLIVKKNKSILKNLEMWLKGGNGGKLIDEPLLLIDDEADNASVNTSKEKVTAINGAIRSILESFSKTTYVGFTATPYANIFIDPDAEEDLFPRDFIYCLKSPSNYIGPTTLYGPGALYSKILRRIPVGLKGLPEIPYDHKKDHQVPNVPESLDEALRCFMLSCAIRDLRGDSKKHMSMLINVSRNKDVHESIGSKVRDRIYALKQSIGAFSSLPWVKACLNPDIQALHDTWVREYKDTGFEWDEIQQALDRSTKTINVRTVNSYNGVNTLDYRDNPEGLRLIAIGGDSLSRGLTLEGLSISYFYRRSQSYDTLMQMGRWFGYRDGYVDLCRIWMTSDSMDWYSEISEATDELKAELEYMRAEKRTPDEFGLLVRNDINGLLITNRNKMRSASDKYLITKSVNGRVVSTSSIFVDPAKVEANNALIKNVFEKMKRSGIEAWYNKHTENYVWRSVPKTFIIEILQESEIPPINAKFDVDALCRMMTGENTDLDLWDIVTPHGDGAEMPSWHPGHGKQNGIKRRGFNPINESFIKIDSLTGNKDTREGIYRSDGESDEAELEALENKYRDTHNISDNRSEKLPITTYLNTSRRRPLLLLYFIDLGEGDTGDPDQLETKKNIIRNLHGRSPIGMAVGFPKYRVDPNDPNSDKFLIKYKANKIYERLGNEDLDEEMMIDE